MLVLSRKKDERIVIGDGQRLSLPGPDGKAVELDGPLELMVIEIRGDKVRLGINAPRNLSVHRAEVAAAIRRERKAKREAVPCRTN